MFHKILLTQSVSFEDLIKHVQFDDITKGRKGAILVDEKNAIVRSTTNYSVPNQLFPVMISSVMSEIQDSLCGNAVLNNAMIEVYTKDYCNMGYHSDQALDLQENSYICLYTCYSEPGTSDLRTLRVKEKTTGSIVDITLDHNSVVIFSTETNAKYQHKIVLEKKGKVTDVKWLGITFRCSKTSVTFEDGVPYLHSNGKKCELTVATDEQRNEFFMMKKKENETGVAITGIEYTLSIGDTLPVNTLSEKIEELNRVLDDIIAQTPEPTEADLEWLKQNSLCK